MPHPSLPSRAPRSEEVLKGDPDDIIGHDEPMPLSTLNLSDIANANTETDKAEVMSTSKESGTETMITKEKSLSQTEFNLKPLSKAGETNFQMKLFTKVHEQPSTSSKLVVKPDKKQKSSVDAKCSDVTNAKDAFM